jgi:hypothetical protein
MTSKSVGAPAKWSELIKPANWKKIEEFTKYQMPRDAIAAVMGVNKDTLLKALKSKGYESFELFKLVNENEMRHSMKRKIFGEVLSGKASDRIKELYIKEYVLPFEEFNQIEQKTEEVKTIYVPINTFDTPEELQTHVENQQASLVDKLNREKEELDRKENDKK